MGERLSSLDNTAVTARGLLANELELSAYNRRKRRKRAFHRAMSGLGRHPDQWWRYAFVTLTSSPHSPSDIQRSWRRLHERMRRRKWGGRYIRVVEKGSETGMVHIHLIVEAEWIPVKWLRANWTEIHGAKVVYIGRAFRTGKRGWSNGLALELGGYLAKSSINRMSYSPTWAWPGLARTWEAWKRASRLARLDFAEVLKVWQGCCRRARPPDRDSAAFWSLRRSPLAIGSLLTS